VGEKIGRILREWIPGLLGVAAAIVKRIAMEAVGAGLGLGSNHGSDCLAEFGRRSWRWRSCLGNRVQGRVDDDLAEDWILIGGAVELVGDAREMLAVDIDGGRATLEIFSAVVCDHAMTCAPGISNSRLAKLRPAMGRSGHSSLIEDLGHIGPVRFQLRYFAGDFDRLGR